MKLGPRKGDAAEVVIIELVTEPVKKKAKAAKSTVTTVAKKAEEPKVEEAPVEEPAAEEVAEEATEAAE
jgi:large subunit ribosomal protein L17